MPRSSRHKSHKQHKHSSKEAREYSDSEEVGNFKERKDREEVVVRVSRESGSSEKRKLASDGKEVPGNGEEYSASKRRKERSDVSGVDRWNGGEVGRGGSSAGDKETKVESSRIDSDKGLKSKVSVDSKSGKSSSRRHESSSEKKEKEANPVLVVDSEDVKRSSSSSKVESKSKSEKESSRKEVHQYKDSKDKEHVVERSSKAQDVKRERSVDKGSGKVTVDGEGSRKQSSHVEERATKQEVGNTELTQEDLRNPKLDKELEKQTRRKRDGSDEKDKYPEDARDSNGRRLSTRDERHKDEKHKEDRYKDKYREDLDRDHRNRDDRVRDDRTSKDHTSDRSDTRHSRDENKSTVENRHKKSKTQNSDHDGSSHLFDDRATRYKDYRGKKRSSDDEDRSDLKPRNTKEHRYEVEKKVNSGKVESHTDRGRSQSRLADVDSTVNGSRRKSSPSSGSHFPKDNFRHSSKQAELKYKDSVSDERVRANVTSSREHTSVSGVVPERASESRPSDNPKSVGKPIHKDKNHLAELSSERSPIPDAQVSPLQLKEKSHSSTSIERRPSNRTPVRRSIDVDETGHRSFGSKDVRDYSSAIEERGSQEWPLEKKLAAEEFPQADGDTVSASSSFNRSSHLPANSSSVLPPPPPFRTGVDSPSVFSSYEEDIRGKSSNRYKRSSDPNVGRGQGNAWKGSPNAWPTSVTNGYPPFQQGPPPGGYHHPMMQQFHGPPVFGVRPSIELNPTGVPYHIPDGDRYSGHGHSFGWRNRADEACPPHLHGWDVSNGAFGDEAHMHVKPDWDQNRHMMSDRGWDASADLWKGQNNGQTMDYSSTPRKEDNQLRAPVDEVWAGKPGQRSRNDRSRSVSRAESIEIKFSEDILPDQVPTEAPKQVVLEKTPEPSKTLNANRFCHVYLSKLDISLELTQPELYNQCRSLLNMERFSSCDDVTKDISTEESGKAGVTISNASLSAHFFPKIKDSVLQRAMTLYKKQAEETKAKFPVCSLLGTRPKAIPTKDGEKLYPDPTINGQKQEPVPFLKGEKEELIPASIQVSVKALVPALDGVKVEENVEDPVPTSGQVIAAELLPHSDQEKRDEAVPNSCEEPIEPDPSVGSEKPEEQDPLINPVENMDADPDPFTTCNVENMELAEDASLKNALQSTITEDNIVACEKSNSSTSSPPEEKKAFSDDTMCGFLGVTDDGSEALAPMPIECKSVNLSWILNSPESTH